MDLTRTYNPIASQTLAMTPGAEPMAIASLFGSVSGQISNDAVASVAGPDVTGLGMC